MPNSLYHFDRSTIALCQKGATGKKSASIFYIRDSHENSSRLLNKELRNRNGRLGFKAFNFTMIKFVGDLGRMSNSCREIFGELRREIPTATHLVGVTVNLHGKNILGVAHRLKYLKTKKSRQTITITLDGFHHQSLVGRQCFNHRYCIRLASGALQKLITGVEMREHLVFQCFKLAGANRLFFK